MHFESQIGHIGGNLSALDAMLYLHHYVMGKNDLFLLSKGHSAGALYVTLWTLGLLSESDLETFHQDGTRLAGHPIPNWGPGILMGTGSLGHGVSLAAGMALAKRFQKQPGRVYCLTSDGEWQEGSTWEGVIFSRHQRLNNLTLLVDVNGLQGFGSTHEVASMNDLAPRLTGFGLHVVEADGHDPESIRCAVNQQEAATQGPFVILLKTVKGKGIEGMENRMESHYLPLDRPRYDQAIQALEIP
ncbi:MAG: transketolase [Magnetococcales bacterium]|nr:transketolase [Magnetococcales bacterium]